MTVLVVKTAIGTMQWDAEIYGQLAVFERFEEPVTHNHYIVYDIDAQAIIACYSAKHVAVNFAKRLDELYDLRQLDKAMSDAIRNLRKHETYIELCRAGESQSGL